MSADKWTSIRLRKSTAKRLSDIGRKGESYDDLIVWLLDNSKKRRLKPEAESTTSRDMESIETESVPKNNAGDSPSAVIA